jgi:tetratricopeptide (TPR) repeat protein
MRFYIILFCCFFQWNLFAQTETDFQSAFQKGNEAFTNQEFEKAANIYEQILAKGKVSFELYYNLGNAYFRLNEIPRSILNYERALQIKPQHGDAQYNLKLANQRTIDQISKTPPFFLIQWWINWRGLFSSTIWSILTIFLAFIACAGLVFWQLGESRKTKKIGFIVGFACLALSILFSLTAWQRFAYEQNSDKAILFIKEYPLKSGADDSSPDILLLHEGTKVELLDKIGLWQKVRLPNGEQGWLPVEGLVKI